MQRKRQSIPVSKLYEHPNNPRKHLQVDDLIQSIADLGLLSPLLVRPWGDGFQIISGHRRKAALARTGNKEADCDVVEMDDEQAFKALMVANIQSQSLSEIEEAEGIREMIERFGWTQERVAKEFSKRQNWVSYRLSLLGLDEEVKGKIITRVINPTQAREIAQAPKDLQSAIADKVVREELSSRETEKLVKVLKDESVQPDVKQRVIETPGVDPEAIKQAAKVTSEKERAKVANKIAQQKLTPDAANRLAVKTEIDSTFQEVRQESLAEHAAAGTKSPFPTDEELEIKRRREKLDWFKENIIKIELALSYLPANVASVIEFGEAENMIARLDKIANVVGEIRQKILTVGDNFDPDGKVVSFNRRKAGAT